MRRLSRTNAWSVKRMMFVNCAPNFMIPLIFRPVRRLRHGAHIGPFLYRHVRRQLNLETGSVYFFGLYTSDPILIKKYLIMNMACGATDVLLNRKQPFSLKTVALIGWSLVSRMKKLGKWTDGIMTNIGRYLSFAEESKLMVAMLHQKEFVCLCNPSGRCSNHASHQTGEVFSSPMLDDYGQIIFRPLLRHVPWADHFC